MDVYVHRNGSIEVRIPRALPPAEYWFEERILADVEPSPRALSASDMPPTPIRTVTRTWTLRGRVNGVQIFEET